MSRPLHLIVLSGAGLSAESGVSTFRGAGGLWEGHRLEEVATPEAFVRTPDLVHRFYNRRRAQLREVQPNEAHLALARLEREWPGNYLHITQNVDDLNERAGSHRLRHMHGELRKVRCLDCQSSLPWEEDLGRDTICPLCGGVGQMRPDIVWFGEMPNHMEELQQAVAGADLFVSIGTSGQVYPAAGFAQLARACGASRLVEINPEATALSPHFHELRRGPATVEVPKLVSELLGEV